MQSKGKVVLIMLFLSIFMMLVACGRQKAKWKGTIEKENEVTIVKNPKEPMYKEDVFYLEEELSIGELESRKEYMFQRARYLAVDNQENIYVLDRKAADIKVFDKKGKHIRTIGGKGQGPGEFNLPGQVFLRNDNELLVYDDGNRSFSYFTLEGDFIKSLNASKAEGIEAKVNSKGNISFASMGYSDETGRLTYRLDLYDKDLKFLKRIASIPGVFTQQGRNLFPPLFSWCLDNHDNLVYGYQKEYKLQIYSPDGALVRIISKEHTPIKITKEEIDEVKKGIQPGQKVYIPQFHPAFHGISIDEEGRIFVLTWERAEGNNWFYYDIFDSKGRYISKIPLKESPKAWKKNKLYTIEEDEEGYQVVKRYKVIWKY